VEGEKRRTSSWQLGGTRVEDKGAKQDPKGLGGQDRWQTLQSVAHNLLYASWC